MFSRSKRILDLALRQQKPENNSLNVPEVCLSNDDIDYSSLTVSQEVSSLNPDAQSILMPSNTLQYNIKHGILKGTHDKYSNLPQDNVTIAPSKNVDQESAMPGPSHKAIDVISENQKGTTRKRFALPCYKDYYEDDPSDFPRDSDEEYVPATSDSNFRGSISDFSDDSDENNLPATIENSSSHSIIRQKLQEDLDEDDQGEIFSTDIDQPDELHVEISNDKAPEDTDFICQKVKMKIFSPREKKSKKLKRDPDSWKKRSAALARERGEAYMSYKKTLVPRKEPREGILCREKCRLQCSSRFGNEERLKILQEFYKLDINAKNTLLFKSIIKKPVLRERKGSAKHKSASYTYSITQNGGSEQVCKEALCALYQIGRKKVDIIKVRLQSNVSAPPLDCRGQHFHRPHKMDQEVTQCITDHIKRFPVEESHYSRNRNPHKKYLSPLLNLSKMFQLYLEDCDEKKLPEKFKIKKSSYSKLFATEFNLSFGHPKSDTCSACDSGESTEEHRENYRAAIEALKVDKDKTKVSDQMVYITIDLQQTMPLPKLTTNKAFYLRQMWFYNFGVHIVTKNNEQACFCTWTEDMAKRGSSEICSSLLRFIEVDESLKQKDHLVIWSDSCAGQNKNFHMICLHQYLILKGYFICIDHKFPEVGHTYLDSDRDFGRIEKVLRRHDTIYVPDKYREIISSSSRKNQVIDMAPHFRKIENLPDKLRLVNRKKNELNETVRFRDGIKWIRVEEYGSYLYKESYDEAMPFKKVNILKNRKVTEPPRDFEVERIREKYGSISEEKRKNLQEQLKYVKPEYRYYYESILDP